MCDVLIFLAYESNGYDFDNTRRKGAAAARGEFRAALLPLSSEPASKEGIDAGKGLHFLTLWE